MCVIRETGKNLCLYRGQPIRVTATIETYRRAQVLNAIT